MNTLPTTRPDGTRIAYLDADRCGAATSTMATLAPSTLWVYDIDWR